MLDEVDLEKEGESAEGGEEHRQVGVSHHRQQPDLNHSDSVSAAPYLMASVCDVLLAALMGSESCITHLFVSGPD